MSYIVSEKGNKLQNWSDILIVVTKHSNFLNETTTIWLFLGCDMIFVILPYLKLLTVKNWFFQYSNLLK